MATMKITVSRKEEGEGSGGRKVFDVEVVTKKGGKKKRKRIRQFVDPEADSPRLMNNGEERIRIFSAA